MSGAAPSTPCANKCGREADKRSKKYRLCGVCSEVARRQRWREKNPSYKDMLAMSPEKLAETWQRLLEERAAQDEGRS